MNAALLHERKTIDMCLVLLTLFANQCSMLHRWCPSVARTAICALMPMCAGGREKSLRGHDPTAQSHLACTRARCCGAWSRARNPRRRARVPRLRRPGGAGPPTAQPGDRSPRGHGRRRGAVCGAGCACARRCCGRHRPPACMSRAWPFISQRRACQGEHRAICGSGRPGRCACGRREPGGRGAGGGGGAGGGIAAAAGARRRGGQAAGLPPQAPLAEVVHAARSRSGLPALVAAAVQNCKARSSAYEIRLCMEAVH